MQNDKGKIVEMSSAQGEKVEMEHPVEAKGTLVLQMARYSLYCCSCRYIFISSRSRYVGLMQPSSLKMQIWPKMLCELVLNVQALLRRGFKS